MPDKPDRKALDDLIAAFETYEGGARVGGSTKPGTGTAGGTSPTPTTGGSK